MEGERERERDNMCVKGEIGENYGKQRNETCTTYV
jgi:hypothetical protein